MNGILSYFIGVERQKDLGLAKTIPENKAFVALGITIRCWEGIKCVETLSYHFSSLVD